MVRGVKFKLNFLKTGVNFLIFFKSLKAKSQIFEIVTYGPPKTSFLDGKSAIVENCITAVKIAAIEENACT